jgi:hypothetical protein
MKNPPVSRFHFLKFLCFLAFVCSFACSFKASAQTTDSPLSGYHQASVKKEEISPWKFNFAGATGFGLFQDIQVPVNEVAGVRGDGKTAAEENATHAGILLGGSIGISYRHESILYESSFDVMQMNSASGPAETQSSSYNRMSLATGAKYLLKLSSYQSFIGTSVAVRRSSFNNVSNGHYIEAILIDLNIGIAREKNWSLQANAGTAPTAHFGFNTGKGFRGERFQNSSTKLSHFGLLNSYNVAGSSTWIDLGLEQERATVVIGDVNEYDNFGLSVTPTSQSARAYDLATTSVTVGFRKLF